MAEPRAGSGRLLAAARAQDGANLFAVVAALTGIGLVMVYSTTAITADRAFSDPTIYLRKQVMWALIAGIAMVIASATDYRELVRWSMPLLGVLALLLVVCLLRVDGKGAHRWLQIGGLGVQPSELGKILLILYLAGQVRRDEVRTQLRPLLFALLPVVCVVGLVAVEPDFGTALFLLATSGVVLLAGRVRIRNLCLLGLPGLVLGSAAMIARFDHVRTRIEVFLHPEADLSGKGYQIHQALIALGSGGTFGVGLGESRQKLYFLPDDHTDFILSILGEEMGLVGTMLVLVLFAALVVFGIRIARRAPDRTGYLVATGLTAALGLQATMNIAVVTASMPTKGISLPFVSYGGSALCVALAAVGLLLNIAGQRRAGRSVAEHGRPR